MAGFGQDVRPVKAASGGPTKPRKDDAMVDRKPDGAKADANREAPLDVLIAGAAYVGLTAAVSLKQARPGLAIAVVDAAPAGV